jgi:Family of unknown function (DUF6335)
MVKRKAAATRHKARSRRAAPKHKTRRSSRSKSSRQAARKTTARKKTVAVARRSGSSRTRKPRKMGKARTAGAAKKTSQAAKSRGAARTGIAASKIVARKVPRAARTVPLRRPPALDRARRMVQGDDIVPTPPSSLDLDRTASAARTGRHVLRQRLDEHTETGPAMTAGDVDADWERASSVGDEAPGGDNPTPDQDVVDDIGRAVGVQYDDNEELKGEEKIIKRDKHRWELDPASSEDYDDR